MHVGLTEGNPNKTRAVQPLSFLTLLSELNMPYGFSGVFPNLTEKDAADSTRLSFQAISFSSRRIFFQCKTIVLEQTIKVFHLAPKSCI
jgi:hypothetical protein